MANTYRIAGPGPLNVTTGEELTGIENPFSRVTKNSLMLRASSFIKPGVERTIFSNATSGLSAVGTPGQPTVNFLIPRNSGTFSKYDRIDLELSYFNDSGAPVTLSPIASHIYQISWKTSGSPLLQQYGESFVALESLVPQCLAVQERESQGFTSTQFSQITEVTPVATGGVLSWNNVMTPAPILTVANGATIKLYLNITRDCFVTSAAFSPPMCQEDLFIEVQWNDPGFWVVQGANSIKLTQARLQIAGRIYDEPLNNYIRETRMGRTVIIPSHLITIAQNGPTGVLAGVRNEFTLQNFTGNYQAIFLYLRRKTPDASVNQMSYFWDARPQTYSIIPGTLVAGSCGNNYALTDLNIFPDGTVSLYVNGQTREALSILAQEACNNTAYLFSETKVMNLFPVSDTVYNDITMFRHSGGAVNLISSCKIDYTSVSTIADAYPIVLGYKNNFIYQDEQGFLTSRDL
jgi:hypothetical protein